ncbi:peripherin [Platysternon megacephalum]|uniref:Peripherin n=1 Tax=Platysternon megacephalum TaxID=55544 RepID=A0A4D9E0X0_9SAUR|nr:peripherin [Platysternon megacephalum]
MLEAMRGDLQLGTADRCPHCNKQKSSTNMVLQTELHWAELNCAVSKCSLLGSRATSSCGLGSSVNKHTVSSPYHPVLAQYHFGKAPSLSPAPGNSPLPRCSFCC